jgi:DNA-binding transcriptional regulator YhcF (GntR family)
MTNKQLSPAAQAVLDAAMNTPIFVGHYERGEKDQIAASLRELVNQLQYIGITEKNILELADELEGK